MDGADSGTQHRAIRWPPAAILFFGLLLRLWFLRYHAFLAGDSILYQDIALNWLHTHIYGLSTDDLPRPTLIRLPGYPAILAFCEWLFGRFLHAAPGDLHGFLPVLWMQIIVDLATCLIVARIVQTIAGRRAALIALALAALCPFTANYTVVPLTETFTIFFLALAFRLLQRWLLQPSATLLAGLAAALSASILLRPDQGLLTAAILPVLLLHQKRAARLPQRLKPVALAVVLISIPFVPWTARNWHTFHLFQPLAPRLANDPGEVPPIAFQRWFRTWAVDFSATQDAYWNYPETPVNPGDLPSRAFDTPAERQHVTQLLAETGEAGKLLPQVEATFDQIATQRIHRNPLRYYMLLPMARVTNMLLHPRTEMLPVDERWWQFSAHPAQTIFATAYAALNLAYLVFGIAGFRRLLQANPATRLVTISMAAYVALRCLLLLTIDNAEQRYTIEFFPIWITAAAVFLSDAAPHRQPSPM